MPVLTRPLYSIRILGIIHQNPTGCSFRTDHAKIAWCIKNGDLENHRLPKMISKKQNIPKKIAFIVTPPRFFQERSKEGEGDERMPSLELFYALSFLKQWKSLDIAYFNLALLFSENSTMKKIFAFDTNAASNTHKRMMTSVMRQLLPASDFYVYYIPLWNEAMPFSTEIARLLKERDNTATHIFFGPHCKLYAEEILRHYPEIDVILTEGPERALSELVLGKDRRAISNITYRKKDRIVVNPKRNTAILHKRFRLDYSPHWDFCRKYKLNKPPFLYYAFSRGCKYNCFFCSLLLGRRLEYRNPDAAINELSAILADAAIPCIFFLDNELNFDNVYLNDFLNRLMVRKMKFEWSSYMIAKDMDASLIKKLRRAGCRHIRWGIESANPERQKMIAKNLNLTRVATILKSADACGIKNQVSFTVGYPYDCEKDKDLITDFIKQNRTHIHAVNIYRFKPRRGSLIYNNPKRFGIEIREDSFVRDEVPFDEIRGLGWSVKQLQQKSYLEAIERTCRETGLSSIDPEVYFANLTREKP